MEDLTQFNWRRATGRGYIWQTLTVRETLASKPQKNVRILTFPTPTGHGVSESVDPHKISGALLWRLAETKIDEAAILDFANAFGLLDGGWMAYSPGKGKRPTYRGEPISIWQNEIARARMVTSLLAAIEGDDQRALAKAIRWNEKTSSVHLVWRDGTFERDQLIASPEIWPETLALFVAGDVIMPARIAIARTVNAQLQEHAAPQLLWSEPEQKFGVYLCPRSLLGAAWVQFAEILDRRKVIGRCEVCGTWFERIRKDKRHCSDRCRVRAMRTRKGTKK